MTTLKDDGLSSTNGILSHATDYLWRRAKATGPAETSAEFAYVLELLMVIRKAKTPEAAEMARAEFEARWRDDPFFSPRTHKLVWKGLEKASPEQRAEFEARWRKVAEEGAPGVDQDLLGSIAELLAMVNGGGYGALHSAAELLKTHKRFLMAACVGQSASALGNRVLAARACLAKVQTEESNADAEESNADAERELERELADRLAVFLPTLTELAEDDPPQKDGIFAWDAALVAYLDGIGPTGQDLTARIREKATERWEARRPGFEGFEGLSHLWVSEEGYVFRALAHLTRAIWRDVVAPRLEQARKKPASLVRAVHVSATDFHSRGPRFDEKTHSLTFQGQELAKRIGATFDLDVIQRGLGLLGSVVSHELFHWEVTTGHEQHLRGIANPHVLEIEGGWVALAERLGLRPEKHRVNLRALVLAQAAFHFPFPDGSRGNMLVFSERPALGRQRAHVRIELGTVLMPGYVHAHGLPQRERKLVPLLRERVPLYGRPNEHGEQRSMSLAVVATLRDRARELVQEGGVRLTTDTAADLADRSGLPRRLIVPVIEHWVNGDTRAPPFLKRTGRERYTLSDVHAAEREFIEDGGRAELQGAELGQRSVKKKRAKLARIERKPRENR